MHSRRHLRESDFALHSLAADGDHPLHALGRLWRPEHRVAFVTCSAGEGIPGCGSAVLLLTHWFYRREEAGRADFFDYPRHYAIVGEPGSRTRHVGPDEQRPWGPAWCRLDVWPSTHHLVADPTPEAFLLAALLVEPQWLFWPASLSAPGPVGVAGGGDDRAVRSILGSRLRGVILYGDPGDGPGRQGTVALSGGAAALLGESIDRLPGSEQAGLPRPGHSRFRDIPVEEFLRPG